MKVKNSSFLLFTLSLTGKSNLCFQVAHLAADGEKQEQYVIFLPPSYVLQINMVEITHTKCEEETKLFCPVLECQAEQVCTAGFSLPGNSYIGVRIQAV